MLSPQLFLLDMPHAVSPASSVRYASYCLPSLLCHTCLMLSPQLVLSDIALEAAAVERELQQGVSGGGAGLDRILFHTLKQRLTNQVSSRLSPGRQTTEICIRHFGT